MSLFHILARGRFKKLTGVGGCWGAREAFGVEGAPPNGCCSCMALSVLAGWGSCCWPAPMFRWGKLGVWGCGVCEPGRLGGGVRCGVGVRLRAGEGELCRTAGQCERLMDWEGVDEGGTPTPLLGPREPTDAPLPTPPTEAGWAKGLLAGSDGGVGIGAC